MKFIDEIEITIKGGSGGNGHVSFLHSYLNPLSGPDGGNGGKGGNIYFLGSSQLNSLYKFSTKKKWLASDGKDGGKGLKTGKNGNDLYIKVPLGTIIYMINENSRSLPIAEIVKEKQVFLAFEGGKGGYGNNALANSVNRTPRYAQNGIKTKSIQIKLELVIIADVGFLGLPNAGKSTLLNALTNANSRSGDYPFTTLNPQLGVLNKSERRIVLADLPGIIEKAYENKGLGLRFLRHVKRCKILIFVIDSSSNQPFKDLIIIQEELNKGGYKNLQKEQLIIWNKIDLLTTDNLKQIRQKSQDKLVKTSSFFISALKNENLEDLICSIDNIIESSENSYSIFSEQQLHRNYDFTSDPIGLEVKKLKNSYWKVFGSYIEKIIEQTKPTMIEKVVSHSLDIESTRNFLLKIGVKNGDILLIDNKEYFWK